LDSIAITKTVRNSKRSSVTLLSKYNANCNAINNANLPKSVKQFLADATDFCRIRQQSFCFEDFNLSSVNFRQKISQLKEYVVPVTKGRPTFYKVRGFVFPSESKHVTLNPMRLNRIQSILEDCKDQPPMIHDIRFKIESNLHEKLLNMGLTPNKNNHSILLNNIPSPDSSLNFRLLAYPKHIQLMIGCSLNPIIYDAPGIQNLIFNLGQYIGNLKLFVNDTFFIQPISKWMHTHSHLNKDGSFELSGESFHCCFEDYTGALYRIYSKVFPDGKRLRVEKVNTEKTSLEQMVKEVMN